MKKFKFIKKDIFWVWDYYPLKHPSIVARIMRFLYWQFDQYCTHSVQKIVYLNRRLVDVRSKQGLIQRDNKAIFVPIAVGELLHLKEKNLKRIKIGFIGVLKKSQGMDFLLDSAQSVHRVFPNLSYEIIGSGPDENYFRKRARESASMFNFYGLVAEGKLKKILYNCTIGIAPYIPGDSNVSYYGDPAKVKKYLEFNLPIIMTDVFEFSKDLRKSNSGIVINYGNSTQLIEAIKEISKYYSKYCRNVMKLRSKFYYKSLYPKMFKI